MAPSAKTPVKAKVAAARKTALPKKTATKSKMALPGKKASAKMTAGKAKATTSGKAAPRKKVGASAKAVPTARKSGGKQKINLTRPNQSTLFTPTISGPCKKKGAEYQPFPFMALPIELRFMIYEELFVVAYPVDIEKRYGLGGKRVKKYMMSVPSFESSEDPVLVLRRRVAFLATSRDIYDEATPYLYGKNTFSFEEFSVMKKFLFMIGDRIQFLKNISIADSNINGKDARFCFLLLAQATKLQRLDLPDVFLPPWNFPQTFDIMKHMLLGLTKTLHDPYAALNVLHLSPWPFRTKTREHYNENFHTNMKILLRRSLAPRPTH